MQENDASQQISYQVKCSSDFLKSGFYIVQWKGTNTDTTILRIRMFQFYIPYNEKEDKGVWLIEEVKNSGFQLF